MATKPKPVAPYLREATAYDFSTLDAYLAEPPSAPPAPEPEGPGFFGRAADLALTGIKGAIGVPEAAVGLANLATKGYAGKLLENEGGAIGFRPKQAKEFIDQFYSPQQKAAFKAVQDASDPEAGLGQNILNVGAAAIQNPSTIVHAVGESIAPMLAGVPVARGVLGAAAAMSPALRAAQAAPLVASPAARAGLAGTQIAASGIGEGAVMAGQAAEQMRQQTEDGLLTGKQAAIAGGIGLAGAGISAIAAKAARAMGIGDIDVMLATGSTKVAGETQKGFVRRVLEGAITEGALEELPQSVVEQTMQNYALGKPLDEGVDIAAVMGTLAGGAMGGGVQMLTRRQVPEVGTLSTAANQAPPPAPTAPAAVAPPVTLTPEVEQALLAHANKRGAEIDYKAKGEKGKSITGPDGEKITTPDVQPEFLTPEEMRERDFLKEKGGDVQALARAYPQLLAPVAPAAAPAAAPVEPVAEAPVEPPPAAAPVAEAPAEPAPAATIPLPGGNVATPEPETAPVEGDPAEFDSNPPHLPTDIIGPTGKPFEYRAQAAQRLRKEADPKAFTIERVTGGYALRPRTGAPNVEVEQPAAPAAGVAGDAGGAGGVDAQAGITDGGAQAAGTGPGGTADLAGDAGSSGAAVPVGEGSAGATAVAPLSTVDTPGPDAGATAPNTGSESVAPEPEAPAPAPQDRYAADIESARAELPAGYSIEDNGKALTVKRGDETLVHGIGRGGAPEALRQAKLDADKRKVIERIDGDDGMYVNIVASTSKEGGFNVVLRDGDAEETAGAIVNMLTIEAAQAKARELLGQKATAPAAAEPAAEDSPEARWTRAATNDRLAILGRAGWSISPPSLSTQRMQRVAWSAMTQSQRDRITAAMEPLSTVENGGGLNASTQPPPTGTEQRANRSGADTVDGGDSRATVAGQVEGVGSVSIDNAGVPDASNGNAAPPKSGLDVGPSNTELRANILQAHPGLIEGFGSLDVPSQRAVLALVGAWIRDLKVLNSVVSLVPVDVMDNLVGEQASSERLLNDPSVLANALAAVDPSSDIAARFVASVVAVPTGGRAEVPVSEVRGAGAKQTATKAGESKHAGNYGASNTVFTIEAAEKARAILRSKLRGINSGVDPELLQAGITLAGHHIEAGARKFAAYAKAMVDDMGDGIRPYLKSFYMAVKYDPRAAGFQGEMSSAAEVEAADTEAPAEPGKPMLDTPEGRQQVAQQVADRLIGGDGFATIVEARKFIGDIIGKKIEPATRDAKLADETVETGVVLAGREIVRAARKQGRSDEVIYDRLVGLYKAQPNLGVRSSTSVREQAYSTPMPLAFLASRRAGVTPTSRVGEPTAGNGALLIEVEPGNAVVNELNPDRAGNLREMGFEPTTNNAATTPLAPAKSLDAEVMNPPFGAVKDGNRESIRHQVLPNFDTIEVDHAIAFEALKALKDDGNAVLILGGVDKSDPEAIREGYRGKGKREFYYHLYQNYKVVDHFTVDGGLYSRQGAAYPVDVVVIQGRGKATRTLPAAELPQRFDSWESLKEKLHGNDPVVPAGDRPGVDGGTAAPRGGDGIAVVDGTGRPADDAGAEGAGPRGSNGVRGQGDGRGDAGQPGPGGRGAGTAQPRTEGGDDAQRGPVPGQGGDAQPDGSRSDGGNRPDGVAGPGRPDGQRVQSGLTDRRGQEQETANQVAYQPKSGAASVGTLVPINMRDPIQASLERVEAEVGNLDTYVAEKLGMSADEVAAYFSAEQVDALALAVYNAEQGKGFIIGDQCVAAGTRIYDPVTREHTPIEELVRRGKPHHVLSLTKEGFRPFRAISFRKGVADLYRVTLDDGRAITVTRQHRFLTPLGWASLGDGIDAGSLVSIHEPGHTSALATRRASAPRDSKTPQDCLDDYFEGSRPCGGQPLAAAGGGQALPPSPVDALERSPVLSHAGGPGASPEHSPSSQMLDRLSRSSFSQAASRGHDETRAQERAFVEQLLPRPHQDDRQSGRSSESCCQAIGAVLADQQDSLEGDLSRSLADAGCLASQVGSTPWQPSRRIDSPSALRASRLDTAPQSHPIALVKSLPASSSLDDYTGWQRVSAVEFVRRDEYFDMHVPGPENYVAEGFVNHNTGIGKGRVVAGMIRYAITNDIVPIFVTEKPNLYSDMIRDLDAIGMADVLQLDSGKPAILMTNGSERIPYTLVRGKGDNVVEHEFDLKAPGSGKTLDKALADMVEADSLGPYKVVFTTYNQLQTVKGKATERMNFARHFGDGGYMIFDESHNAGGNDSGQARNKSQREQAKKGETLVTGRASFVRGLVGKSAGSFFSSATYAKRPDVMDLYSSTNMMLAVDRPADLGPAIKAGGVPMQQSVATMLTEDGQYIRRERTFAGVTYETRTAKVDRQTAENMATAMRRILQFSRAKEGAVNAMQKEADREGARMQVEGEKTQIQSANFGSIMHNLIDQMLLALKAKDSVDFAVERLKAGEKVVLTVSNTMGSFLKEYADQMGLRTGEPVALTFKDLYQRYLEKQRWIKIKKPGGSVEEYRLTDEDLGEQVTKMFTDIQTFLDGAGFGEAPISPIDYMHAELRKAGFKTDEITGRTAALNYETGTPILATRKANIRQRLAAIRGFNNGEIDALILNQSGSTGLSLHASKDFKDQRPRRMIVVQAEKNIDTHMQILGRVHRTGQVVVPAYTQSAADIPAEARPAAVLLKKMASLSANTTASRKSAVAAEGVVDFMNDYGAQVAHEFLMDNPDVHQAIGGSQVLALVDDPSEADEADIRKLTGYIPILPIEQQEQVYADLIERYNELIAREDSMGTNKLEARALDLDAKQLTSETVTPRKAGTSRFAEPANMERLDVKRTVKPMTGEEVRAAVADGLNGKTADQQARELMSAAVEATDAYRVARLEQLRSHGADQPRLQREDDTIRLQLGQVRSMLTTYPPGTPVTITDKNGGITYGVVTSVADSRKTKNPAAGSSWKMTLALANGDARSITVNFGQIGSAIKLTVQRDEIPAVGVDGETEWVKIPDLFDRGATVRREKRWMVTGNILAGFAKYPGQIVSYTKNDGTIGQGVLMSRSFDFDKAKARAQSVFSTVEQVSTFFAEAPRGAQVGTEDGALRIVSDGYGSFDFITPSSKKEGGKFYLDEGLTGIVGDFFKSGQIMRARVRDHDDAMNGVRHLLDRDDVKLVARNNQTVANKVLGVGKQDDGKPMASRGQAAGGQTVDAVRATVAKIKTRWANAPEIVVAESIDDPAVPQALRDEEAAKSGVGAAEGYWHDGKVYLLADKLGTEKDVARVLMHETLGHHGMRAVFGADFGLLLDRMGVLNAGKVRAAAAKLGLDFDKQSERRMAAEEVLAYMAQNQPELGWVSRALAAVRTWARAHIPGFGRMAYSDSELIRDFILPARRWVEGGGPPKGGKVEAASTPAASRGLAESLLAGMNNVRDVRLPASYMVHDLLDREGKLSWWHKTVGTPYNLAQRSAPFKRVFDAVQNFLSDASYYSAESAALAPDILPKLEDWKDITKTPLAAEDAKALGRVTNEGTLLWRRDERGRAIRMEDLDDDVPLDDKAHQLLRAGKVTPEVLRMWQGLPMEQYEKIIEGKFEREMRQPGIVFTPAELKQHFGLSDKQIGHYQQYRAAMDRSIGDLAITEMLRYAGKDVDSLREQALTMTADDAAVMLRDHLFELAGLDSGRADTLNAAGNRMIELADHAKAMQAQGYAPLSRFGTYTLEATTDDGERFFSLYETPRERSRAARQLREAGATDIKVGTMSQEDHKLFNGITPETAALFGEMLGLDEQGSEAKNLAFQEYVKRGIANRSAMKRLLRRKGIAGYSEDAGRVLASFIVSNGRKAAANIHTRELDNAVADIPKEQGELKDTAIKLREYVRNPQEEAHRFRALLFAQYLGGSIASAMVNATQPFAVSFPYLSQFGGARKSGARLAAALKLVGKGKATGELAAALKKAEEEGIVSPQEIHSLQGQAMGRAQLTSGDGTRLGDAQAAASNTLSRLSLGWGKVFGVAEQFNRRLTFIAAYNTAVEEGIANPAAFAEKAINETQFLYNKGNKPRWARGAVGSVLFTFRQYSVNYIEVLTRMATAGEPGSPERAAGQRAAVLALAVLFMLAGAEGLPFVEDIQDLIDGALQRMGYNFSSKQQTREFLARAIGRDGAQIVANGLSGLPGAPIDFSGRLSMGNLIPGTGMFHKKTDRTRDLMEVAGAGGDMVKRTLAAGEQLLAGDAGKAAVTISPVAGRNLFKMVDMLDQGMYRDERGRKVLDTTTFEAVAKGIGFQPRSVAMVQEAGFEAQRQKALYTMAASEIREKWARARFEDDADLLAEAKADLADWNERNPTQKIQPNMPAIIKRVREMRKPKLERIADSSPAGIRASVREQLAEAMQ